MNYNVKNIFKYLFVIAISSFAKCLSTLFLYLVLSLIGRAWSPATSKAFTPLNPAMASGMDIQKNTKSYY